MIHHIVMIKLKEFSGKEEKLEKANEIIQKLQTLPAKINEIKYYDVGLNIVESERAMDIVIVSKFNSLSELKVYIAHVEHQKVVTLIREHSEGSKVVDFEK